MREHWYEPGDEQSWLALAAGEQLLAVGPRSDLALEELWSALASGFQAVLDALTSGGLSATPPFALLSWGDEGLRAIVRGPARLVVAGEDAGHVLDGTGVSTWTERMFGADAEFELGLGATTQSARALPLVTGAALARRITSGAHSTPSLPTPAVPVPAAEIPTLAADIPTPAAGVTVPVASDAPSEPSPSPTVPEATIRDVSDQEAADAESASEEALLGETVHRVPTPVDAGDHDGMTIMTADLRRMRGERKARPAAEVASAVPSPTLTLVLSNGATEPLDRTLIVGRAPSANKVSGGDLPRLITIPGDKDISRNHAQFAVEGGTVVVTDLHSRNGTQVIMPGRAPQQLRQGEPTAVIVGTTVDLGGGVTLTVREGD